MNGRRNLLHPYSGYLCNKKHGITSQKTGKEKQFLTLQYGIYRVMSLSVN
jgi:hypothetical protein